MTDVLIIGAGPAGLTAAIYALRAGKTVLILEKGAMGGQLPHSPKIENYPGFAALSGNELITLLRRTEQHRLYYAVRLYGLRKLLKCLLIEALSRLRGVRLYVIEIDVDYPL